MTVPFSEAVARSVPVLLREICARGALCARTMFVTASRRVSKMRTSPEEAGEADVLDDAGAEEDVVAVGDGVGDG
jgi:hypothetical protein